ncbi:hypothetical protein K1719_010867 [Acacia pycnantha]|nr:hypothetical protein K1719_010867 [Acacia pycnantha]
MEEGSSPFFIYGVLGYWRLDKVVQSPAHMIGNSSWGFLELRLTKWLGALITRSFAIVPTIAVAIVFNTSEASSDILNEWLNVLQSMQIPFALIPLLTLASKEQVMGTFRVGPILEKNQICLYYCSRFAMDHSDPKLNPLTCGL